MGHIVRATMAGTLLRFSVQVGEAVQAGQEVAVIESMKMEIPLQAEAAGRVKALSVTEGGFVNDGDAVIELE